MTARRRPQPHRFGWPLTAQQLQDIDDTFQILFDELKRVDDEQHDASFIPAHAPSHGSAGTDPITISESQVVGLTADLAAKVPNSRQIISGAGLTGGGDLSADRTLDVGAGTGITVNANDVALDTASTRNTDHAGVTLTAGTGLTGGGDITASRTFDVGAGTNIASNANDVAFTPQAGASSKLLGRGDSGSSPWEVIALGTNLSMSGTTLNAASTGSVGFTYTNGASSTTWTIVHNLGTRQLAITCTDNSDLVIIPNTITYTDVNTITVTWTSSQDGFAYIVG